MTRPAVQPLEHVDLLVVGGGPAALRAATGYRDHGGHGAVVLVSADDVLPYARPPLSKDYLRGDSEEADAAMEPAATYAERRIDVRLGRTVTALDTRDQVAQVSDSTRIRYESCVLATGAAPRPLPVPGADDPRVMTLRSLASARTLRSAAEQARSAVVVGSGFIGCEAAVSLARRGLDVTVVSVEELPQQARLGAKVGRRIAGWLAEDGVHLIGGVAVSAIEDARLVRIGDHGSVRGDLVLVAAGIDPQSALAIGADALMHEERVVVDERMRSSVGGLLAAGDVAYAHNTAAGRHLSVEHWGEAETMGAIAGATAAGGDERWAELPGFWSVLGDHTLKYAAWGDGHDDLRLDDHGAGAFTVWYSRDGILVGVLTHDADDDYERGGELVERGASVRSVSASEGRAGPRML